MRPQPGQARSAANLTRLLAGSQIVASHRYDDPRVQDAYSVRCSAGEWGHARHVGPRGDGRRRRAALGHRQPGGSARWPCGICELSRRAAGARMRLPGHRGRRGGRDRGSAARTACSIRTARTGSRRFSPKTRGQPRTDARALHPGRDGGREPPTVRARERRFAAYERHAGRPRVDGLGCGAQAAHGGREPGLHPCGGAHLRRASAHLRAPLDPGPHGRAGRRARGHSRARAGSLAGSGAGGGRGAGRLGRVVEAVEGAIGSLE